MAKKPETLEKEGVAASGVASVPAVVEPAPAPTIQQPVETKPAISEHAEEKVMDDRERLTDILSRLESADAERNKAYEELLALQKTVNEQVERFSRTSGGTTVPARKRRGRPPKTAASASGTKRSGRQAGAVRVARGKKRGRPKGAKVKCSICGKTGHNARTCPEKSKASQAQE